MIAVLPTIFVPISHSLQSFLAISDNNANTTLVPVYIFTNGTYSVPVIGSGIGGLLGVGSVFNFFPGFGFFGRSFQSSVIPINWKSLFGLYAALKDTLTIVDEDEKWSCFQYVLCSNFENADHVDLLLR